MPERFPGYDVLAKRHTASWNEVTRRVIDHRLAMPREPSFFTADEWLTLSALCDCVMPQPANRPPIPLAAMVDNKMAMDMTDGYRNARLPKMQEAWRRGLHALDAESAAHFGGRFHTVNLAARNTLVSRMQQGELHDPAWQGMPPVLFFSERVMHDVAAAYYSHPIAWNEIGFGGPASPRGYVRMGLDRRDPWEAVEASPGHEELARRKNRHVG